MGEMERLVCFAVLLLLGVVSASDEYEGLVASKLPRIERVSPNSGVINGGTYVRIFGKNMAGVTHCRFGLNVSPVLRQPGHISATAVTCVTPAQDPGTYEVQISQDNGVTWLPLPSARQANPSLFAFYTVPDMLDINPNHGPCGGKTFVRLAITGWNDVEDHSNAQVMFGDKLAKVESSECEAGGDSCWLLVQAPELCAFPGPGCDRTVLIRVSLNGQDFTLDPKRRLTYRYDNDW